MFAKRVLDSKGREWAIEKRCTPWHRLVRPVDLITESYPHRRLTAPEAQPAESSPADPSPREPWSLGLKVAAVVLTPLVVVESIGVLFLPIFMFPFVTLELALLGIAGFCLWLARAAGLARQRVDVTCWTGRHLHSETVLLVHGQRRARQLVEELVADRFAAQRPFSPTKLPADVTVRSQRSIWQSPDKWIPSVKSPSDPVNQIRETQLEVLVVGTFVVLLVALLLEYLVHGS